VIGRVSAAIRAVACFGCTLLLSLPAGASAAASAKAARISPAGPSGGHAPSQPPLLTAGASAETTSSGEEADAQGVQGEADPLVSNGLGSPTCKGALAGQLPVASRSHCETSGFIAAPAPTGDYGLDVHIDTGLLGGFSTGGMESTVQDALIGPLWNGLLWAVHALVVMLEWCFTIDLLDSPAAGGLARGLRQAQTSFTEPWLVLVLALAAMVTLYQGIVRRRVADTLGEMLVMAAMMVAGLWVIADPTGTVGALGEWANEASLGTMAVAATGTPSTPGHALGDSLNTIFATAIEAPWCYLEFGNVDWCREPARLQRSLQSAGLAIAAQELSRAGCASSSVCAAAGGSAQALAHSAELLRQARSNGAIFLALPANGPARNSINEQGSLLRTICQSEEATNCHGPAAAAAEFRTGSHTWARMSGLLLIAAGLLGMMLLFGFLAIRLLTAAIFSLLYLMLAPAVVLAPAFGESGRAMFRKWGAQLLGAVVSKLLFSFLLGVVLAVLSILSDLTAIGWWTQWLLMSAFWWATFMRRHQALDMIGGTVGRERVPRRSLVRRVGQAFEVRGVNDAYSKVKKRLDGPPPDVTVRKGAQRERSPVADTRTRVGEQPAKSLRVEHHHAKARSKSASAAEGRNDHRRSRLQRVRSERVKALAEGDRRRVVSLQQRGARIEGEIEREQASLSDAKRTSKLPVGAFAHENHAKRERLLDAQAKLPSSAHRVERGGRRRDYAELAGLAGYAREEYQRLGPKTQRSARLEIDRELALRSELGQQLSGAARRDGERPGRPEQQSLAEGRSREPRSAPAAGRAREQLDPELLRAARQSPVMRDARDVASGRKRQLGRGRP
jgi:hypothetical protein